MRVPLSRFGAAALGCAAAIVSCVAVTHADPPDPHQPDLAQNYCPGGQWTYGSLVSVDGGSGQRRMCDGQQYPMGRTGTSGRGSTACSGWNGTTDCVSGSSAFPAPPPPGGCAGAIPPA